MGLLYSVYVHTTPNGKRYVGITSRPPKHRWNNGRGYSQNKHFTSAILKYGWENIRHEIVEEGLSKFEACALEKYLISKYKSNNPQYGYNNSAGGEYPNEGHKATEEEKKRKSEARKGIELSEETKKRISQGKKGKPNGKNGLLGEKCAKSFFVYQIDPKTQNVVNMYFGFSEMERKTGYARTPVREAAHGKRRQAYGFVWTYEKRGDANVIVR